MSFPKAAAALIALAVPFALGGPVAQATPNAAMKLNSAAAKSPSRTVVALAQFKPGVSDKRARAIVRAHHGKITNNLPAIGGFAVKLSAKSARELKGAKGVLNVTLNTKVKTTAIGLPILGTGTNTAPRGLQTTFPQTVGATALNAQGLTGKGVGVAVIDSGIAGDHPGLQGRRRRLARRHQRRRQPGRAATAGDGFGHGTHVAGIIAGNSYNRAADDPFKGKYVGIAPDAEHDRDQGLRRRRQLDRAGRHQRHRSSSSTTRPTSTSASSTSRWPRTRRSPTRPTRSTPPSSTRGRRASSSSPPPATAATPPTPSSTRPANDPFVISVGGDRRDGTNVTADGKRADWSSRGVTQDGFAKPDVVAPGAHIVSAAGPEQRVPVAVPELRHRRPVLQDRRHLDGRPGRRRRRRAAPAGPPDAHARTRSRRC